METIQKEKLLTSFVEVKKIYLHARRWFQRSYGNTYHTVEIWVNDHLVHKIPFTYGYGDQWSYNAGKWLVDNGYGRFSGYYPISRYCRESGIEYNHTVEDVKRKRDL
jgi:hypothetical protein